MFSQLHGDKIIFLDYKYGINKDALQIKVLRAYIRVARIIRIVRFLQGGWPINIYHSLQMIILGQQMY